MSVETDWNSRLPNSASPHSSAPRPSMLAVTIGVGKWRKAAELAAAAARQHTGLDVVILDDDVWEQYRDRYSHPAYLKLHVFDLVDAENVLFFDADAIHLNDWNPQQYADSEAVVAVQDFLIGDGAAQAGVPFDEYFNSGLMILNRTHHESILKEAQNLNTTEPSEGWWEQPLINKARFRSGVPFQRLPRQFNHLRFFAENDCDLAAVVVGHYTPHAGPEEIERFIADPDKLCIINASAVATRVLDQIAPCPQGKFSGRGIVICAGGVKYLTCAWVQINLLRRHGCQLPIEVWYLGDVEGDTNWIKLIEPLGVTCMDACEVARHDPHPRMAGWESKSFAILHSRFQEILFLDADNVPVADPTYLFDTPEYQATGAIFWPDGSPTPADSPRWKIFGVPYRDEKEQESGQILIDKSRSWKALHLCDWYNRRSDFFYRHIYGDKDTFRFAWHRVGQPFCMPKGPVSIPFTICQLDPNGKLIFQHRCGDKWSMGGNRRNPQFLWEAECLDYVRDLRGLWNPMLHAAKHIRDADRKAIEALVGTPWYLKRQGFNGWPIRLGKELAIAEGSSAHACGWWMQQGKLVLWGDDGYRSLECTRQQDGSWHGIMERGEPIVTRLLPLNV